MKWLTLCSFALCLAPSLLLPAAEPAQRAPLPDAAAIAQAESQFHDRYEGQLVKARRAAERRALAEKFLDQSSRSDDAAALRLVLLRQARQLAVELADADLLRRSVEAAASQFQIDLGPMRKEAFAKAAAAVRTPTAAGQFAEACLGLVDGAAAADDFAAALDYGHAAYAAAGKARDKALLDKVVARGRLVVARQKQFQQARGATANPAASPDGPQTNVETGRDRKPLAMSDNGWADLLKLIDPARPGASPGWDLQGGQLHVSPKGSPARLAIPVAPGGSYDVKLEFTRTDSFEMLGVVLPVGNRQCLAAINFAGGASGLDTIDGRRAGDNTSSFGGVLTNDRRYTLEISVQVDGQEAAVTASLDGRPMFFYRGPLASLALAKEWSIGSRNRLGLVSQAGAVIHSFRLRAPPGRAVLLDPR